MTPDMQAKIVALRQKAQAGNLTEAECREAITFLRGERMAAAEASTPAKRAKAAKVIPTAADLLSELGDL